MQIKFVKHKMKRCDRRRIENSIRSSDCIVTFPSTSAPFYLMDKLRHENTNGGKERRALMDNNILTKISPLLNGGKPKGKMLDIGTRESCALIAYVIYTGIEMVPELSMYEKQTNDGSAEKRRLDDIIRIASHLEPQVFADLSNGKISDVTYNQRMGAIELMCREVNTLKNTKVHNYGDVEQPGVLIAYLCMMKDWIIQKTEINKNDRLEGYLQWSKVHMISNPILTLVSAIVLSGQRKNELTVIKKIARRNNLWVKTV